ncbi:pentatricopeptide repeat-containing protein [Canna indica]|uniref:Pentatricopeptide repeat-containing protein n=1 Tax=Canna indica TaxID=4628 RepID=A0AAQ3Q8S7_9LILI|nr:pentatricopeptide repeat-containing protein [Canna indica]
MNTLSCAFQPVSSSRAHTSPPPPIVRRNAQDGLRKPSAHSVASCSSLILAETKRGEYQNAFELFSEFLSHGWSPDEFALGSLLRACSSLSDASLGGQLHAKSIRAGLASERGVRSSLISMYSANGFLDDARRVFDETPPAEEADVPTWNSVISAYAFHGLQDECFDLFRAMLGVAQLAPTDATLAIVISACSASEEIWVGKVIHAMILKDQTPGETKMRNSLISMYAKWGHLDEAKKVFERIDDKDVVSWNAIIAGLEQNGECDNAVSLFRRLSAGRESTMAVKPNRITFLSLLTAIATISALRLGKEVHGRLIRSGLDREISIGNSLITMYAKCGEVEKARLAFKKLPCRDVISWNSLLSGYAQNNDLIRCYYLFEEMLLSGFEPDLRTLTVLLSALSPDSCRLGREAHGFVLKRAAPHSPSYIPVYNAMIAMYSKLGRLGDAEKVFVGMSKVDSYTWNSMMDGYSINESYYDATMLFVEMQTQGFPPDYSTFSIILTVCSKMVSIELGKQLHASSVKQCLHVSVCENFPLSISNALVSMYSKCGSIDDAAQVFERMPKRDVVSWTSMITGYAHHGMAHESFEIFEAMRNDGVRPNSVTYLGLLSACVHGGLVEEGIGYFNLMREEGDDEPNIEHYACMVDLFGRAGEFEEAEEMVEMAGRELGLKGASCLRLWKVLLGACHARKQLERGIGVGERILEVDPDDETTHVLLSNLYAANGSWEDAISMRRLMREKGLKKGAGCSWVEIRNRRHVFVSADCYE